MAIKVAHGPGGSNAWYCDICWQRGVICHNGSRTDEELVRDGVKHRCRFIPTRGTCILRTDLEVEHLAVVGHPLNSLSHSRRMVWISEPV